MQATRSCLVREPRALSTNLHPCTPAPPHRDEQELFDDLFAFGEEELFGEDEGGLEEDGCSSGQEVQDQDGALSAHDYDEEDYKEDYKDDDTEDERDGQGKRLESVLNISWGMAASSGSVSAGHSGGSLGAAFRSPLGSVHSSPHAELELGQRRRHDVTGDVLKYTTPLLF